MEDSESPNALLLGWVKEWLDVARERNSKGVNAYRHAYHSLKACPLTFQHPSELKQLKGFGPKLCERLTEQLQKHCEQNGLPMPEHPQSKRPARGPGDGDQAGGDPGTRQARKPRKQKAYVPALRSGGYAIILGLSTQDDDSHVGMTKDELIEVAQPHCDSSFTAPSDPTKFYTAWNSIKTLIQKELVYERGRPLRRYALTDEGWETARRIKETSQCQAESGIGLGQPQTRPAPASAAPGPSQQVPASVEPEADAAGPSSASNLVADGPIVSGEDGLPDFAPITVSPGQFSVRLLLDVREVRSRTDRDYMKDELARRGVTPIMRSLEVGDAQWIAKCHDPTLLTRHGAEGDEIVLDWIVERKRLDDLIGSIKDGRFHEQKFRLKRSGSKKVIYIIEEISMDPTTASRYEEAVQSAIASTQVVNGFFVKKTSKMDETIDYLARMTAMLKRTYERGSLNVIPTGTLTAQNYLPLLKRLREREPSVGHYITYAAFASLASKSEMMTLRDVFLKMLMTTRGVTGERALEIQKRWKTPHHLVKAFEACGTGEQGRKRKRELLCNSLGDLVGRKKVTKALSQRIAEVWGDA